MEKMINGEENCGKAYYGNVKIKDFINLNFEKVVEIVNEIESSELIINDDKKELLVSIIKAEMLIKAFKELQDTYCGYFWINEQDAIVNFGKYINSYFPSIGVDDVVMFMSKNKLR